MRPHVSNSTVQNSPRTRQLGPKKKPPSSDKPPYAASAIAVFCGNVTVRLNTSSPRTASRNSTTAGHHASHLGHGNVASEPSRVERSDGESAMRERKK